MKLLRIVMVGALAATWAPVACADDGWDWYVAPYLWASGVTTDLHTDFPPINGETETDFSDIVDKLDGAFQIHIEGQGDRFGMFADFTYLGISDDRNRPRFSTDSDVDTRILEVAGVWSPGEGRYQGLDVFAGVRVFDIDATFNLDPTNPALSSRSLDVGKTATDLMVGLRYTIPFSDRWGVTLRGDGSTGDTEGTWNVSAIFQYKMRRGLWAFGYRHMNVEIDTGGNDTEIEMSGPIVGYAYKF